MGLPYTALLTVEDVARDAFDALDFDTDQHKDGIEKAIAHVTGYLEGRLGRTFVVRPVVQFVPAWKWRLLDGDPQGRYYVYADQWPVVEVTKPTSGVDIHPEGDRLLTTTPSTNTTYDYFAGYRRADQDLSALQAATDPDDPNQTPLSSLTVLPPVLPGGLLEKATEFVLYRLYQSDKKLWGTGRTMQQIGTGGMSVAESADKDFVKRLIRELAPSYRKGL